VESVNWGGIFTSKPKINLFWASLSCLLILTHIYPVLNKYNLCKTHLHAHAFPNYLREWQLYRLRW
jgi:hypothetical protein